MATSSLCHDSTAGETAIRAESVVGTNWREGGLSELSPDLPCQSLGPGTEEVEQGEREMGGASCSLLTPLPPPPPLQLVGPYSSSPEPHGQLVLHEVVPWALVS